jgi:hypothetical protein
VRNESGAGGPPAMDAVLALAERHGVQITGPLGRTA